MNESYYIAVRSDWHTQHNLYHVQKYVKWTQGLRGSIFFCASVADRNHEDNSMVRSISVATGLNNTGRRPRVKTIFPHKSGNNKTLLSFDDGDIITLLIPDEKDGWLYGELEKTRQ